MMHALDTTIIADTACKEAAPMLQNMATRYECDFDELYQQAYLVVLERLQSLPDNMTNLKAWLHSTIRLSIIHSIYYTDRPESLDKPLNEDNGTTYGDLLAAPAEQQQDTSELDHKIEALYAALRRLPLDEQRYAREVFGLNAYQPIIYDYKTREKDRTRSTLCKALYRHLRHDPQLASEVLS